MRNYLILFDVSCVFLFFLIIFKERPLFQIISLGILFLFFLSFILKNNGAWRRSIFSVLIFLLSLLSFFFYRRNIANSTMAIVIESPTEMEGYLSLDSGVIKSGANLYNINLTGIENTFISQTNASRSLTVLVNNEARRGLYRDEYRFSGIRETKAKGLYVAEGAQLLRRSKLSRLRLELLVWLERRIGVVNKHFVRDEDIEAKDLALKLLFARSTSPETEGGLDELIKLNGLNYIFALSGMHLMFVAGAINKIFARFLSKRKSKILSLLFVSAYFFISCRSSSFIRAYIMYLIAFVLPGWGEISLFLSFLLQNIFFPLTCSSLSFDFSYAACVSIVVFNPLISTSLSYIFGKKISNILSLSLSALLFSVSVSLIQFGEFRAVSIVVGPVVSMFAMTFLFLGVAMVVFPGGYLVSFVARWAYICLERLLEYSAKISLDLGLWGYITLILFCIFVIIIGYFETLKARSLGRESGEMSEWSKVHDWKSCKV